MIRNKKKTSKFVSVLSAVIAVVMLGTTVFASGVLSDMTTDDYTIEITKNGEKIELINKPFIENGEVYLPLREMFENHLDVDTSRDETYIKWDNGKIKVGHEYDSYEPKVVRDYNAQNNTNMDKVTFYSKWSLEIGNPVIDFDKQDPVQMKNAPILRKNVTYIPYIYLDMMLMLDGIGYKIYDKNRDVIYIDSFYYQVLGEYSIKIPDKWSGKYIPNLSDNIMSFVHKATYEKYGGGTLFSIEKVSADRAEEILNMLGGSRLLYSNDDYAYIFEVPTDVQYPIWTNRDEEDIAIAAEYEEMFEDIHFIANSFDVHDPKLMMPYEPKPEIFTDAYYDNAENLSFDDMNALQNDVDNGHYPWRLDTTQTILEYAHSNNVGYGEITELTGTGVLVNASYTTGRDNYQVELFKPIRQDETGVWVVRLFEKIA